MSDRLEDLKAALAGRYEIDRELGRGGMATVYLADDVRHHRKVAVKVLRPDLAAALGGERFLREIRIAANLTHPHILPLHDSGEADGFLYYVMPHIKGDTLRERLEKENELPVGQSVRIIREVVDALAFAHSQGVIHRDIKPDNIMLSGGHAMVMDFGVAKAVSEATGRDNLTTAGVALGIPAYMSPEQATADQNVDHRSDIYAVGAMAYELLAGRPPFQAATPQGVLAAQVTEAAEPVSKYRDQVSPELEVLVMKCLAKKPADRWQSSDEMLPVLEGQTTTSGGMTPVQTRPLTMAGTRNRNMVLIAAALVGAGVVAAAGFLLRGPSGAEAPPAIDRQVTFRGDVEGWPALSRDGRIIAYRVDGGRSLMVQDLAGGGSNTLVSLDDPGLTMEEPYWGPDDSRLFFHLTSDTSNVIASVPRLGGPLRTEVDLQPLVVADFGGFSASGGYLIMIQGPGETWIYLGTAPRTLRWVSADSVAGDGPILHVAEAGNVWLLRPSPDGRWLAYSSVGEGDRLVAGLISTDGTRHTILAEGLSDILTIPLGWSPASDAVYYPGFATQRTEILSLPIDPARGTRAGEPVVVIRGLETGWEHVRSDGTTLIYAGGSFSSNVRVIDLTDAPQATAHPTVMLTRGTANNMSAGLGAGGEVAVFQRWTGREATGASVAEIYTQPSGGGVERLVARRSGGSLVPLEMSPDGRRVAYYEWGAGERSTLVTVNLATGEATELPLGAGLTVAWAADGQRLATSGLAWVSRIMVVDLRDSSEVVVELQCDTNCALQAGRPVFSPDGSRIAFRDDNSGGLWIAALADGHATQVAEEAGWTLNWTEDGIYYVVEVAGPSGDSYPVIYRVAPQGGAPQLYARLPEDCNSEDVALSFDASTAVCGVVDWKPDVHIVENFDGAGRR